MWLFSKELHSPVCTVHKSPATQYITPRELVVTHLIALSPSKFLFYVLHCFHLRTELPWKYPQQIRITILFRNSDFKQSPVVIITLTNFFWQICYIKKFHFLFLETLTSFIKNFEEKDIDFLKEWFCQKICQTDDVNCAQVKLLFFFIIIFSVNNKFKVGFNKNYFQYVMLVFIFNWIEIKVFCLFFKTVRWEDFKSEPNWNHIITFQGRARSVKKFLL